METHFAMEQAGLLTGQPSNWSLTDKGKEYATETSHWNGVNGSLQYVVDYSVRTWDDRVLDLLDFDDEKRRAAQQAAAEHRRKVRQEREAPPVDVPGEDSDLPGINGPLVLAARLVVIGVGYGIYKLVPRLRRRWDERRSRPEESSET